MYNGLYATHLKGSEKEEVSNALDNEDNDEETTEVFFRHFKKAILTTW